MIEGQGRYAKIEKLEGEDRHGKGTFYYLEWWNQSLKKYYSKLIISEVKPSDPSYKFPTEKYRFWREAILDLSGYSLRVGIRIKLFK